MAKYNKKMTDTSIRIGEVRFSYANVFQPRKDKDGEDEGYSLCVLIPKKDKETVMLVEAAVEAAKMVGKTSKWNGKIPANCKGPMRDGDIDREDDPAFEDCWFINTRSRNKPGIRVLENGMISEALDGEDFYSGAYGAVSINFFPYDYNGNKGVGAGLNNAIKTRDGERLAGGSSAEEDFADLAEDIDPLS
jgi:hypothetical protein